MIIIHVSWHLNRGKKHFLEEKTLETIMVSQLRGSFVYACHSVHGIRSRLSLWALTCRYEDLVSAIKLSTSGVTKLSWKEMEDVSHTNGTHVSYILVLRDQFFFTLHTSWKYCTSFFTKIVSGMLLQKSDTLQLESKNGCQMSHQQLCDIRMTVACATLCVQRRTWMN